VPTVAFVALAAAEGYVERVVNKILDWLGTQERTSPARPPPVGIRRAD
jgi:hypothetical protein